MRQLLSNLAANPVGNFAGSARASAAQSLLLADEFDFLSSADAAVLDAGGPAASYASASGATAQDIISFSNTADMEAAFAAPEGPEAAMTLEAVLPDASFAAAPEILLTSYTSGMGEFGFTSGFNIEIIFEGTWTEELQQSFIVAAEYLSYLIQGDIRDSFGGVDDIRITATLGEIDGPGGVLGQAGPTFLRFFSKLPSRGVMEFDIADAEDFDAQNLFDDIVLHEMMHSIGMGTIWDALGLTSGSVAGDDMRFTGFNARLAYNLGLSEIASEDADSWAGVPVETDGGPGTAGGHWDEETFENELMSGYIDDPNYISAMTVAALEDMGYDTLFDPRNPNADILQPDEFVAMFA